MPVGRYRSGISVETIEVTAVTLCMRTKGIGTEKQYYVTHPHGNVVQLTDESGAVIRIYEYDSFGNEVNPDSKDENLYLQNFSIKNIRRRRILHVSEQTNHFWEFAGRCAAGYVRLQHGLADQTGEECERRPCGCLSGRLFPISIVPHEVINRGIICRAVNGSRDITLNTSEYGTEGAVLLFIVRYEIFPISFLLKRDDPGKLVNLKLLVFW